MSEIEWAEASKKYNINKWRLYRYIRNGLIKKLGYREKIITHRAAASKIFVNQKVNILLIDEDDIKKLPIEVLRKETIKNKPLKVLI